MGGGRGGMGPRGPPRPLRPFEKVDREKVCPFLLRVFPCEGGHHRESEFISINSVPSGEVHLYTWSDATFSEISNLLRNVNESMRVPGVRLSYAVVAPNHQGQFHGREVAVLNPQGGDGQLTLGQVGLEPGDFLDVAVFTRRRNHF
uniref:Histone deacetylase complex subunit SAP18 n=1 Tax=Paramoeba aestuarina TaxID=180227 RepID=A0A7S4KEM1_9EUKA|mmetsp:Transcript_17930/g.28054  ORF Transcript_17930/g.28054 Transcript_17930/m.28054 type:complete len:146 (+) Transcript_17930:3-440(+)